MPKDLKNKEKKVKQKSHFFKDTKAELKKVIWPTPKQLVNSTLAVVTLVVIIGLIVFVLDFCFEKANKYGVNQLKSIVQSTNSVSNNEETNSEDTSVIENTENVEMENTQSENNSSNDTSNTSSNVENAE